jgi:hypothetical protein
MLTFLATREHLDKLSTGGGPSLFDPRASPDTLATLALRFQIAQKLHACTDPHDSPASINDRPRDVVDLLLLRDLVRTEGRPTLLELRVAAEAIFAARADDARALGRTERTWPCAVVAHEHLRVDFAAARTGSCVDITLEEAVVAVNSWVDQIAEAT